MFLVSMNIAKFDFRPPNFFSFDPHNFKVFETGCFHCLVRCYDMYLYMPCHMPSHNGCLHDIVDACNVIKIK